MRLRLPGKWEIGALSNTAILVVGAIGRTMRVTVENPHVMEDRLANGVGQVLVTWHGRSLVPMIQYRNRGMCTLISPSRDGEIQYRVFRWFGWEAVRGSSGRDASKATLDCVRRLRGGATLGLAPDGPKGPACVARPGALYFALKAGCPVVPAGVSASPSWTFKSWDSFQFPKPFSRAVIVFGDPITVPADADDEALAALALSLGEKMNDLQRRADALVGAKP